MHTQLTLSQIGSLIEGTCGDPGAILGPHRVDYQGTPAVAVRGFFPDSSAAWVVDPAGKSRRPMQKIHPAGFFEAICPAAFAPEVFRTDASHSKTTDHSGYTLQVARPSGEIVAMQDPYAVPSILTDFDRYLIGEGNHHELYNRLGAQVRTVGQGDGQEGTGVNFAVWAPNARTVQVVGDFNGWDGRETVMRVQPHLGIWELFVPGAKPGDRYKYRLQTQWGEWVDKADPVGFAAELPPLTASVVADLNQFEWSDDQWMQQRAEHDALRKPFNVYEVHLGSWQQGPGRAHGWLDYKDLAHRLTDYCHRMNFTHVELMPVSEHPFTGSWGYQTVGYFAPTSRHGSPDDFMYFVNFLHQNNIGVLIDWVPAHFPKDGHGLYRFDGTPLYEHADPRQGEHPDWGTMIFNYGRNEVRNFLVANALFWLDKYHIDGLRVDAVASMLYLDYSREGDQWIPNQYGGRENLEAIEFIKEFNVAVHEKHPGAVTVAEESTAWPGVSRPTYDGGLGFTFKWNMGWMNDTLRYMRNEPIHRKHHQDELTFSLIYAFTENFVLPLSHDEVVHGKGSLISQMPGDMWQKFANLRLLYSYMWTHPGKNLLFMGGELAQWTEWHHDHGPQWELLDFKTHRGVQNLVADLNQLVIENPALHAEDHTGEGFEWVDCMNSEASTLVYLRKAADATPLLVCCNFTPVPRENYRVGVPTRGFWREILNSDAGIYGGSNMGNYPGLETTGVAHHGRPDSVLVTMPPLGVTVFRLEA
ncbi:1,4-alpha-glucan branching protein GlgB [Roseimaritima sediminicola]|uniref:1,4-alpha-glucan branching protein GlgB n=1 Tax=Roseimaritima sediminicola TaxID=2662066 RepID=UPI0012983CCE|nr:1,4-alpha-glucan branching protein GlgB [Roseimaritima sediminicola]